MSKFKDELLSKNGRITIALARGFMSLEEGNRILTIEQYSKKYKTGRGTIQSALKKIQSAKALSLESRGHLGTFIRYINYEKLWEIADIGIITGVMPLPYSNRYEGLATGLYKVFQDSNIPFKLAYMRGALNRIDDIESNLYNFAIVSKMAADEEISKRNNIQIINEFTDRTYSGEHVILFNDNYNCIKDGMKVAVDSSSVDQVILTKHECNGMNVQIIDIPYNQIPVQMERGKIDATIWNSDELQVKYTEFKTVTLKSQKAMDLMKSQTKAVIVGNKYNKDSNNILKKVIDMAKIEEIQLKVINKEMVPLF